MNITRAAEASIHAVSPLSIVEDIYMLPYLDLIRSECFADIKAMHKCKWALLTCVLYKIVHDSHS